jgi:hypothetical protein
MDLDIGTGSAYKVRVAHDVDHERRGTDKRMSRKGDT